MTKARSLSDFIESDGSVTLVDNQKIKVGTGNDLQIYHDGLNSYVQDSGTGSLRLAGADVGLLNAGATDFYINCSGTTVTLYHNGSPKLATTSSGVNITGTVDADDLYITGGTTIDGNFAYFKSASTSNASLTLRKDSSGADSIDYLQLRSDGNTLIGKITGAGVVHSTGLVSSGSVSGTTGTFTDDVAINNGSPELYFGTTGTHYNWRIAAQETVDSALTIDVGSQDTDYSNDTYSPTVTLKYDGNTGFGTTGPEKRVHIFDSTQANQSIRFGNPSATPYGEINYNSTGSEHLYITSKGTTTGYGNIVFQVGGTPSEAMRIDANSNIGINTQSPTAKLDVRGSVNSEHAVFTGGTNSNRGLSIQTAASGSQQDAGVIFDAQDTEGGANPYIQLKSAGQTVATFSKGSTDKYPSSGGLGGIGGNGANLQLDADDSEIRMANNIIHSDNSGATKFSIRAAYGALNSGAELSLDGGHITFNAGTSFTQVGRFDTDGLKFGSDTAAVNGLDDYEEGTATLTMSAITTAPTITQGNTFTINYTKIGNLVRFVGYSGTRNITNVGTGGAKFTGLPFAQAGSYYGHVTFAHSTAFATDVAVGYIESGNTFFYPITLSSTSAANYQTGTRYVMVQGIYHTA